MCIGIWEIIPRAVYEIDVVVISVNQEVISWVMGIQSLCYTFY